METLAKQQEWFQRIFADRSVWNGSITGGKGFHFIIHSCKTLWCFWWTTPNVVSIAKYTIDTGVYTT
jgi:hypothetical protein